MINYENLKMLFNINKDTFDAYNNLIYSINKNGRDLLYICKTKETADFNYNKIVERNKYHINKKDKQSRIIELKNKDKIYIWTIGRLKAQIDGYKFRDIRFR